MQARDHIEDAVADDKSVEPCSLPLEYAVASPHVDCKGGEEDWNVCNKENHWLGLIHLNGSFHIME